MFCPKCKTEYGEGFNECADCKISLVRELSPKKKIEYHSVELVKLKNFPSRTFAEQAKQILEKEGILSVINSPDVGIMGCISGDIFQGVDLYVPKEFAEKAKEIIYTMFNGI